MAMRWKVLFIIPIPRVEMFVNRAHGSTRFVPRLAAGAPRFCDLLLPPDPAPRAVYRCSQVV